jgi:hypothetical protein
MALSDIEMLGVPEFYTDRFGGIEHAGNGIVRLIRSAQRGGAIVPVVTLVCPAIELLRSATLTRDYLEKMMREGSDHHFRPPPSRM